jgi:hypothetical protein
VEGSWREAKSIENEGIAEGLEAGSERKGGLGGKEAKGWSKEGGRRGLMLNNEKRIMTHSNGCRKGRRGVPRCRGGFSLFICVNHMKS